MHVFCASNLIDKLISTDRLSILAVACGCFMQYAAEEDIVLVN